MDGIFSMEGGAAPVPEIYAPARQHDALLVLDEAHALGVVGAGGRGTAPHFGLSNDGPALVLTASLSKALGGASGGLVAGPRAVVDQLRTGSRSWIFTQGMTTANAATALAALEVLPTSDTPIAAKTRSASFRRAAAGSQDAAFYPARDHDPYSWRSFV